MTLSLDMLRHGVTDGGPGFRGSSDDALTEQGRQQMRLALAGKGGWDLVISSPLQRCESFAREFAEANGLPLRIEDDLRELHFGAWEGRNSAQVLLEDPEALGQFWNDPYHFTPPEAEPVRDFAARVLGAVERLQAELDGQRVLLVTHGGVMRLLLARARQLPENQLLQVEVGYGAMHGLQVEPGLQLTEA
ncbi:histidine phosphatase family protein [Aquipseudomonas alcaligenes]|uniref:Histidine phosphatase family protein n=1 Tax=Aquipseudomonas alcaligenes TaxID=43263 RepID=A0A2V4KVD4_AQUAC|nr:alpha-ribazole phosphatase family protein [Pseudomonas alcaligenes]PYC25821.1 histidine phosphatase family protein [Pseudomonas alcaligenes]